MIGAGYFGVHVTKSLSAAGFRDPHTESSTSPTLLSQKFGQGDLQMVFTVHSCRRCREPAGPGTSGLDVVSALKASPYVASRDFGVDRARRPRPRC